MKPTLSVLCLACLFGVACDNTEHAGRNTPPTVIIESAPGDVVATDSVRFTWVGRDVDGTVLGYYYSMDDSAAATFTESTGVTWYGLTYGPHTFFLQALDDSGARSVSAARSFTTTFESTIQARGSDTTLEIATWNVENFPLSGAQTVSQVRRLIQDLDLDIYGVEEIADTIAFQQLLAGLPGYAGLYSRDDYGSFYQKTGVIYKTSLVSVSNGRQLFWSNDSVTRPPLEMSVTATVNGRVFDFVLIVQHLKAGEADDDAALRRATIRLLKDHIDDGLAHGTEPDYVVVGDWNDELDDPPDENVFQRFLDDPAHYQFLTLPLAGRSQHASYIGGGLIDQIMVTSDALVQYGNGTTATLRLDDEMSGYRNVVSDHRPVMAVFTLPAARR